MLYLVASEALLKQNFMQMVMKLPIPQKKPKFLVVKEEHTKQIKSTGISNFCPQIRYECTVCFQPKTSAWLCLKMPSLTQRRLNHRLETVIAILRDVPRASVVHHSVFIMIQANTFIISILYLRFNSGVKNSNLWPISDSHCIFWPSPLSVH